MRGRFLIKISKISKKKSFEILSKIGHVVLTANPLRMLHDSPFMIPPTSGSSTEPLVSVEVYPRPNELPHFPLMSPFVWQALGLWACKLGITQDSGHATMWFVKAVASALAVQTAVSALARILAKRKSGQRNAFESIPPRPPGKTAKKICVVGTGISGIQAIKVALQNGCNPTAFEEDSECGGFWRFKAQPDRPSVYESTHIDVDRDMAGYADCPWNPKVRLTLRNDLLVEYLKETVDKLGLGRFIRFNTKVLNIEPHDVDTETKNWRYKVTFREKDQGERMEIFDGVLIASGRHGGGAWIPEFEGLSTLPSKKFVHSSQYKSPQVHNLKDKVVVVVGVGNSGLDCVTEISPLAKKTILVSRSGAWISRVPHGDIAFSTGVGDRITMGFFLHLPWIFLTEIFERVGLMAISDQVQDQAILNKHGLKPKHRFWQQHTLLTGLNGRATIHDELEAGRIVVKKGISKFTARNGGSVAFEDDPDNDIPVDFVVFATGYKQQASYVDPQIVDMRFDRTGNDLLLYKYVFPCNDFGNSFAFVNLVQTVTFFAADLQSRAFFEVFHGRKKLPSPAECVAEVQSVRATLCAQFIDRSQLRVQAGANYLYYEDLAEFVGCLPTLGRILRERPTAYWHAFWCTWTPMQYRLVGPGRFDNAEKFIEERYLTRYYSKFYPAGTFPDRSGQVEKGSPVDCGGLAATFTRAYRLLTVVAMYGIAKYALGMKFGTKIQDALEDNIRYAKDDITLRGISHSLNLHDEPQIDSKSNKTTNASVIISRKRVWN